jgi:isocitrate dehydrogenase
MLYFRISDAATMQIIRWTGGGFGMAAHNYDGDMLTDEVAQVHRSPGFITSNLIGRRDDGVMIKEYEASHGTCVLTLLVMLLLPVGSPRSDAKMQCRVRRV